ncbi:hypothetical protein ACLESO_24435 [Pyxidicoccus sp. 3LG]
MEAWTIHGSLAVRWTGPAYARGDHNVRLGDAIYRATQDPAGRVLERCSGRVAGPCVPAWTPPGVVRHMMVVGRWLHLLTAGNLPGQSGWWTFREGPDGALVPAPRPDVLPSSYTSSGGTLVEVDPDSYLRVSVYQGSAPSGANINEVAYQRLGGESWAVAGSDFTAPAPVTGVGVDDSGRVWLAIYGYLLRAPQEVR